MSEQITTIIITTLTVAGGAGAWKFYEFLIRNKREKEKEELSEQNMYRDDLRTRVERLENDKDECTMSLRELSTELAAIKVKLEFLERENDRLKYR
jgi:predicted nuclease with TOPRIM domain|tara:strand:+ start:19 stop:306 length:288 start_codon:yes stop_codon:yes gene_type:complete